MTGMTPQELTKLKFKFYGALVCDQKLSGLELRVAWLLLTRYLNAKSLVAWPSKETLARDLGSSSSPVRRALKRLVERKWFKIEHKGGGRRHANVYSACLERGTKTTPSKSDTMDEAETGTETTAKGDQTDRERGTKLTPNILLREPFEEPLEGGGCARGKHRTDCPWFQHRSTKRCSARRSRGRRGRVSGSLHAANPRRQPTTKEASERAGLERLGRVVADQPRDDEGRRVVVAHGDVGADRDRARRGKHRGRRDPRPGTQAATKGSGIMDRKITALRRVTHKLMHQAAQLRQVADELDRLAAVFARADADRPEECPGAPDGQAADTET